jgi:hypothetical protein
MDYTYAKIYIDTASAGIRCVQYGVCIWRPITFTKTLFWVGRTTESARNADDALSKHGNS